MSITGVTAYEGPSVLDGKPIICIATFTSTNVKTGNMVQTWILRADFSPAEAVKEGHDVSVCGVCPHRHYLKGACYVVPYQAPSTVWRKWKAGNYPTLADLQPKRLLNLFGGRALRLGSYGDPAAVPYPVWQGLVAIAGSHTGYTHQYRHPAFDSRILEFCMVSTDTQKQAEAYHRDGLRTFRVKQEDQPLLASELECPASDKTGHERCLTCMKCSGARAGGPNIVIDVHGSYAGRYLNGA